MSVNVYNIIAVAPKKIQMLNIKGRSRLENIINLQSKAAH